MSSLVEITRLIATLTARYPNFKPDDMKFTAQVWHSDLRDYLIEDVLQATQRLARTPRQFAPNPGEIIHEITQEAKRANGVPDALTAWEMINGYRAITRRLYCPVGADIREAVYSACDPSVYNSLLRKLIAHENECTDCKTVTVANIQIPPIVERVARSFGWPDRFPGENVEADRAHWLRQYEQAIKRAEREAAELPQLRDAMTMTAVRQLAEGMSINI